MLSATASRITNATIRANNGQLGLAHAAPKSGSGRTRLAPALYQSMAEMSRMLTERPSASGHFSSIPVGLHFVDSRSAGRRTRCGLGYLRNSSLKDFGSLTEAPSLITIRWPRRW